PQLQYFSSSSYSKYLCSQPIYTCSLHDALPILGVHDINILGFVVEVNVTNLEVHAFLVKHKAATLRERAGSTRIKHHHSLGFQLDRKSTRLNSSHVSISYAVFCLNKKRHSMMCP